MPDETPSDKPIKIVGDEPVTCDNCLWSVERRNTGSKEISCISCFGHCTLCGRAYHWKADDAGVVTFTYEETKEQGQDNVAFAREMARMNQ